MKIRYYAMLRDATGVEEMEWKQAEPTVGALVNDLCECYGTKLRRWLYDGDRLAQWVIIMVNGRDYRHLQGLETPLYPDDTVTLFPPIAGG